MQTDFFDCRCHSAAHTIRFDFDTYDGELYVTAFLKASEPWYRRLWVAVRYVFGRDRRWGDFDCFVLQPHDRFRFAKVADEFKRYHNTKSR